MSFASLLQPVNRKGAYLFHDPLISLQNAFECGNGNGKQTQVCSNLLYFNMIKTKKKTFILNLFFGHHLGLLNFKTHSNRPKGNQTPKRKAITI